MPNKGKRFTKVRWVFERYPEYYSTFGLGLVTSGGSLGFTWGEPGANRFREVKLTFAWWTWVVRVNWKDRRHE